MPEARVRTDKKELHIYWQTRKIARVMPGASWFGMRKWASYRKTRTNMVSVLEASLN